MTTTPSVIGSVIDRLVTIAGTALGTANVIDGIGVSDQGQRPVIAYIGIDDPDNEDWTQGATSDQEWAWVGHDTRRVDFTVNCCIISWNGKASQKAARDGAFTALQAFTDAITADPTLGGLVLYVKGVSNISLVNLQDADGAHSKLSFSLPMAVYLS